MYEHEITVNKFLLGGLDAVLADIPNERVYDRAPGNGHQPIWVLGHLAICAELGHSLLGQPIAHEQWLPKFGPGSPDEVAPDAAWAPADLITATHTGYARLQELAANADASALDRPHGIDLLDGTPIENVGQLVSHLLSSHFSFHLAQLSGWRRAAGHGPLF